MASFALEVADDELWPRDAAHRFRLYVRRGEQLEVLAAAPSLAGVGYAIGAFYEDDRDAGLEFADRGRVGILDCMATDTPQIVRDGDIKPRERLRCARCNRTRLTTLTNEGALCNACLSSPREGTWIVNPFDRTERSLYR